MVLSKFARFPFLTVTLIVLSAVYFVTVHKPPSNDVTQWILLGPIIHKDILHIGGNIFGLAIVGFLFEYWVCSKSMRMRLELFLIALAINYAMNLIYSLKAFFFNPSESYAYGLSLLVYIFLGFALYHYWKIGSGAGAFHGWKRAIPIGIGVVIGGVLIQFVQETLLSGLVHTISEYLDHFAAFFLGMLFMRHYVSKKEKRETNRKTNTSSKKIVEKP